MTALFDIDLEEIAQVVERRTGQSQMTLLLDRRGLGVALRNDQPAQVGAVLSRHFLPRRLPLVCAEVHLALRLPGSEEDAPTIFGHPDVVEVCPTLGIDAHCGAQINLSPASAFGAMSSHHCRNSGCQCSSARCKVLLLARSTLLGIFSA